MDRLEKLQQELQEEKNSRERLMRQNKSLARQYVEFRQQLAAANARVAELEATLNETYTDDFGTVWTRPTAWAYAAVCNANDKNRESKEQAEAQCNEMEVVNTELQAQNKRMREALRKIINVTSNCLSHEEMKDKMKNIAKAALEEK